MTRVALAILAFLLTTNSTFATPLYFGGNSPFYPQGTGLFRDSGAFYPQVPHPALLAATGEMTDLAVDSRHTWFYWTTESDVHRSLTNGTNRQHFGLTDVGHLSSIAVDRAHQSVFWADAFLNSISRSDLDGGARSVIVDGLESARELQVDPPRSNLFWIEATTGRVQRANYDGTDVRDIITGLGEPSGLAIDSAKGHVYVSDLALPGLLHRTDLDGSNPVDVPVFPGALVGEIAVVEDKVYWSDLGGPHQFSLWRANLDGSDVERSQSYDTRVPFLAAAPVDVPEPSSVILLGIAGLAYLWLWRPRGLPRLQAMLPTIERGSLVAWEVVASLAAVPRPTNPTTVPKPGDAANLLLIGAFWRVCSKRIGRVGCFTCVLFVSHIAFATSVSAGSLYSDEVLRARPVGYWRFEDAAGDLVADFSGGVHDGTSKNLAVQRPGTLIGMDNFAAGFNGASSEVRIPFQPTLAPTGVASIEAWVRIRNAGRSSYSRILSSKRFWSQAQGLELEYNAANNWLTVLGGGSNFGRAVGVDLRPNEWNHVVATISDTTAHLYVNGQDVTTDSSIGALVASTSDLFLGRSATDTGLDFWDGSLDEVALYDLELSATTVWDHFLARVPGDTDGSATVDLADFGTLKASFGRGSRRSEGDFNGDAQVDLSDFGVLKQNFGATASQAVPEPCGLALLAFGGSLLSLRLALRR